MPERPALPTAEGTLAKTPIAHLLAYLAERGLTGSLAVAATGGGRLAYFRDGSLVKVRPSGGTPVDALLGLSETTTYRFYEGVDLLPEEPNVEGAPLDPLDLIRAAVITTPARIVDDVLARLGGRALKVHPEADVARFRLDETALAVVSRMRAVPASLSDLIASNLAQESIVRHVVYLLAVTRHFDHGTGVRPIGFGFRPATRLSRPEVRRPDPPELPALTPELAARRAAILERANGLLRQDHFAVLGVERNVNERDAQAAYYALAKIWHTDRLPTALSDVREVATAIFARMTEAFEVLSDPVRRAPYLASLEAGPAETSEEDARVHRILEAASEFQKAEIFLRKHDLASAELMAARACEGDPDQVDYIALHVSVLAARRAPSAPVDDLISLIDNAILRDETSERALFCRATLLKRAGKTTAAIADFRRVVEQNPRNVDAQRELRIFDMRKGRPAPVQAREGASRSKADDEKKDNRLLGKLSKLFKR